MPPARVTCFPDYDFNHDQGHIGNFHFYRKLIQEVKV